MATEKFLEKIQNVYFYRGRVFLTLSHRMYVFDDHAACFRPLAIDEEGEAVEKGMFEWVDDEA